MYGKVRKGSDKKAFDSPNAIVEAMHTTASCIVRTLGAKPDRPADVGALSGYRAYLPFVRECGHQKIG